MKVKPGTNSQGPWCDGVHCGNTEHAPGNTEQPSYDPARPFALETHFEPGEGNIEKHIKYPTSRLPLWFGGGHSSGLDRYEPWGCNVKTGQGACNPAATDDDRNEVNGEFGPYAGNVPCYDCWRNAAHQFENIIAAMVKRYGPPVSDNKHFGCQNNAKAMGDLNYNHDFFFPGALPPPLRGVPSRRLTPPPRLVPQQEALFSQQRLLQTRCVPCRNVPGGRVGH